MSIRALRGGPKGLLSADEPVLVTRHGRPSGVYLPLCQPDGLPESLRQECIRVCQVDPRQALTRVQVDAWVPVVADVRGHERLEQSDPLVPTTGAEVGERMDVVGQSPVDAEHASENDRLSAETSRNVTTSRRCHEPVSRVL